MIILVTHINHIIFTTIKGVRARLLARARAGRGDDSAPDLPGRPSPDAIHPVKRRRDATRWIGWAVAAGLASLLLTHHSFHAPLSFGWITAAVLGIVVVGLGIYISVLRDRLRTAKDPIDPAPGQHSPSG
jgi:hypothetical protein